MSQDLIQKYEAESQEVARLERELQAAVERARGTLGQLLETSGKGPYTINGKNVVVMRRRGTVCAMPATRNRKPKSSD